MKFEYDPNLDENFINYASLLLLSVGAAAPRLDRDDELEWMISLRMEEIESNGGDSFSWNLRASAIHSQNPSFRGIFIAEVISAMNADYLLTEVDPTIAERNSLERIRAVESAINSRLVSEGIENQVRLYYHWLNDHTSDCENWYGFNVYGFSLNPRVESIITEVVANSGLDIGIYSRGDCHFSDEEVTEALKRIKGY